MVIGCYRYQKQLETIVMGVISQLSDFVNGGPSFLPIIQPAEFATDHGHHQTAEGPESGTSYVATVTR